MALYCLVKQPLASVERSIISSYFDILKIEIINTLLRIPAEPGETIWVEDEETMRANFDKLPRGCPRPRLNFDEFLRAAERGRGRDKGTARIPTLGD